MQFGVLSRPDSGGWRRIFRPGAFSHAIHSGLFASPTKLCIEHDDTYTLDDTRHGLRLSQDKYGLRVTSVRIHNPLAFANVAQLMQQGELGWMSACLPARGRVQEYSCDENTQIIQILSVRSLPEISLCNNPAMPGTVARVFDPWATQRSRSVSLRTVEHMRRLGNPASH